MYDDVLSAAREWVHDACQPLSRAARANVSAAADDSHSAFQWASALKLLRTQPTSRTTALAFDFDPARFIVLVHDQPAAALVLRDVSRDAARQWLDEELRRRGLQATDNATMPYALSFTPDWAHAAALAPAVAELGRRYEQVDAALHAVVATLPKLVPGPSPVTLWPHHFDMATLVQLQPGDPATAPSIGVGYSPGDENYALPYLYCSPYPTPADTDRSQPPDGWQWHTDGFVSLVCTAPPLDSQGLANAWRQAFQVAMATYSNASSR